MSTLRFDPQLQKLCTWSGMLGVMLFIAAFFIAGFLPPPSPLLTQEAVVRIYQENTTSIRIGMLLMLISSMFVSPIVAVIAHHLRRMEGKSHLMAYTQLSSGTVNILFFVIPAVAFLITSFRPDRPAELTYLMNDFSWLITVIVWPPAFMQNVSIGIAILRDRSATPVFPRWLAYFQFWIAIAFVPAGLIPFFKSGPFAWNGLLSFWIAGGVFAIWYLVMPFMLLKAIKHEAAEHHA